MLYSGVPTGLVDAIIVRPNDCNSEKCPNREDSDIDIHVRRLVDVDELEYEAVLYVGWRQVTLLFGKKQCNRTGWICTILENTLYLVTRGTDYLIRIDLNDNKDTKYKTQRHHILPGKGIVQISSTDSELYLVTDNGDLYKTGCGREEHENLELTLVPFDKKVRSICCGKEHVLILAMFGQVYCMGSGSFLFVTSRGQLGNGTLGNQELPSPVPTLAGLPCIQIEAGGWHCLALSDSGDIYAWGWNESGQVGVLTTKRENGEMKVDSDSGSAVVLSPTLLFSTDDDLIIDSISCGSRHSAAVSDCGVVYTWGWNGYNQLFLPSDVVVKDTPTEISVDGQSKFSGVLCGGWSSLLAPV